MCFIILSTNVELITQYTVFRCRNIQYLTIIVRFKACDSHMMFAIVVADFLSLTTWLMSAFVQHLNCIL